MSRITLVLLGWLAAGGVSSASSPARLYVRTLPPAAKVLLGGESLGTSDGLLVVPPGPARIAVKLDGRKREIRQIEIQPEQITRVEMQLQRQPELFGNQLGGGRDHRNARWRVILPPAVAGTPLSFQIQAQANYFAAYGDMVESMAIARKINAEATALEIQQSIDAVDAYFKRRELNKENRKYELDPQEMEKRRQERMKRNVDELYQKTLEGGDVTRTLNWLLQELAGPTLAYQYLPGGQTLTNSKLDQKLSPDDLKLIRLTDGGGKIKTLIFAAGSGTMLEAHWPFALQAPEFQQFRQPFEAIRDEVVDEARNKGQISYERAKKLQESVIALMVALEAAYPREVRADPEKFLSYITSKRFLQGLWGGVHRATTIKDLSVFSGRLRFQGNGLVALIQHMYGSGLEFAPPEPGGEGVYRKLFHGMRNLYVNIGSEKPETGITKP
jgi:hypothetical protein